jgi:hypothetical protein
MPTRRPRNPNTALEPEFESLIDEKKMWAAIAPLIKSAIDHGGGADKILSASQSMAGVELVRLLRAEKEDVRLRAAAEILNRSLGKPVERRIDLHAELKDISEPEIDSRIKTLVNQIGGGEVIDGIIAGAPAMIEAKRKRGRPRNADRLPEE